MFLASFYFLHWLIDRIDFNENESNIVSFVEFILPLFTNFFEQFVGGCLHLFLIKLIA